MCCCCTVSEPQTVNNGLNQAGAGDIPGSKLAKWSSIELYELIVSHNDHIPTTIAVKQDRSRALIVFRQYDAMIAPDEKKLLFDRHADVGEKEVLKQHLHHLVVAKFVYLHFKREGQSEGKVPRGLKKKFEFQESLWPSTIEEFLKIESVKNACGDTDEKIRAISQEFRVSYEKFIDGLKVGKRCLYLGQGFYPSCEQFQHKIKTGTFGD